MKWDWLGFGIGFFVKTLCMCLLITGNHVEFVDLCCIGGFRILLDNYLWIFVIVKVTLHGFWSFDCFFVE